jgi:glutamine cyclotransferase
MPSPRPWWLLSGACLAAVLIALVLIWGMWGAPDGVLTQSCRAPAPLRFETAGKIVRSELGFTQGLEFRNGELYESTGRIGGTTRINTIALTGRVRTLTDLGTAVFGEGLTILGDEIFQLTWQDHQVFVYDLAVKRKRTMRNPREGWGLTNDGTSLIFSDGGPSFYYADPKTFAIRKSVKIRTSGAGDVQGLNELELVRGRIYGNIFTTWTIVRIDPGSGCIDGTADLRSLRDLMTADERAQIDADRGNYVLNGIAYDEKADLFYLTGKRWSTIFSGRFTEVPR